MKISRAIRIQGCGKEYYASAMVDLSSPTTIGYHDADHPLNNCYNNNLPHSVVLGTQKGGITTFNGVKVADVSLTCYATDCPDHVDYKPLPTAPAHKFRG